MKSLWSILLCLQYPCIACAMLACEPTRALAGTPLNDNCNKPFVLEPSQSTPGTTIGANLYPDFVYGCSELEKPVNGVWYVPGVFGTTASVTLECEGDHELLLLCGNCNYPQCLRPPITCGQTLTWCESSFQEPSRLLVRSPTAPGDFTLTLEVDESKCVATEGCIAYPSVHDSCSYPADLWPGFTLHSSTGNASASLDEFPPCDGRVPGGNGVWFRAYGGATGLTATLECKNTEHELLVFCPACFFEQDETSPACLAAPIGCGQSTSWCPEQDSLILVRSLEAPGEFTVRIDDDLNECVYPSCEHVGNDVCSDAYSISIHQYVLSTTLGAQDEDDESCGAVSAASVWYKVVGNGSLLRTHVCSDPDDSTDHTLNVYCNSCEVPRCLPDGFAHADCVNAQYVTWCSNPGETYYLRVDGTQNSSGGVFALFVHSELPCDPAHDCSPSGDTCETADDLPLGQTVQVGMGGATSDQNDFCILHDERPGVWFDVLGDGTVLEASVCSVNADDPFVRVHCGGCESTACIEAHYTPRDENYVPYEVCEDYKISTWRWCSRADEAYHLHVADWADSPDNWFEFTVKSTGQACANAADCIYDPPPANDDCADAIPISGEGVFDFENSYATPEEPYDMCHFTGTYPPTHDVWYCWTSPCDGPVTVETCGLTTVDTQLAVYPGCDCQQTGYIDCNNDYDYCGYQSHVEFDAAAGQTYRIQVGTRIDLGGGSGQFRISCGAELRAGSPCEYENLGRCVNRSNENAVSSTRGEFVVADNFTMKNAESVDRVCWWGAIFDGEAQCTRETPDDFTITYYADYCGKPWGIVGGPFSQSAGTLITGEPDSPLGPGRTGTLIGGLVSEIGYTGRHDPVALEEGQSYWIEITNAASGECSWYWETLQGNDPFAFQSQGTHAISPNAQPIAADVAFSICFCEWDCLDRAFAPPCYPIPENDTCEMSQVLEMSEVVAFKTTGASTDGVPVVPQGFAQDLINYFPLGDRQIHKDVWFELNAYCLGTIAVEVCNADFDVKTALYPFHCEADTPIAIDDDSCGAEFGLQSRLVTFLDYQTFGNKLRVGGYRGDFGSGEVTWNYIAPETSDLRVFAVFANCRSAGCAGPTCNPLYGFCCGPQDFDADGDVDLDDYVQIYDTLVGP